MKRILVRLFACIACTGLPGVLPAAAARDIATVDGAETADVPIEAISMAPPPYPKDMAWQGVSGVVLLVLTVDAEGRVVAEHVERSSSHARLDQAAVEGARAWTFRPAREKGKPVTSRVRVPVDFKVPAAYAMDRVTGRPRDAYFAQRRRGDAPAPKVDGKGMLPGHVADALPIGVASVEEAQTLLQRYAFRERDAVAGLVTEYTLRDEEGISHWNVAQAPGEPSLVVRRRLVGNATMSWYVTSLLCEGAAASCNTLTQQFSAMQNLQPRLPPLPVLPPLKDP
jgi:TonB family protein